MVRGAGAQSMATEGSESFYFVSQSMFLVQRNCLPSWAIPVVGNEFFGGVEDAQAALIGGGHQAG
jgi:hypothetical protein